MSAEFGQHLRIARAKPLGELALNSAAVVPAMRFATSGLATAPLATKQRR